MTGSIDFYLLMKEMEQKDEQEPAEGTLPGVSEPAG